jgi:hypothetical protein
MEPCQCHTVLLGHPVPVKRQPDRVASAKPGAKTLSGDGPCGTGVAGAGGFHVFDGSKAKGDGSAVPAWADGTCVRRVGVPQERLRSGLETIGGDSHN